MRLRLFASARLAQRLPRVPVRPQLAARWNSPAAGSDSGSSSSSGSSSGSVTTPVIPLRQGKRAPLFDTYALVTNLKAGGMPEHQAVNLLEALIAVTEQANEANLATLATKAEFSALGSQLNEKLFNSTLKYDMQLKHIKELFEADLNSLRNDLTAAQRASESDFAAFKSDIRMNQKVEIAALQQQIVRLEKEIENSKQYFKSEMEHLENKLVKLGIYSLFTIITLVLTILRLWPSLTGSKASH